MIDASIVTMTLTLVQFLKTFIPAIESLSKYNKCVLAFVITSVLTIVGVIDAQPTNIVLLDIIGKVIANGVAACGGYSLGRKLLGSESTTTVQSEQEVYIDERD